MKRVLVLPFLVTGLIAGLAQPASAATPVAIYHMEDSGWTLVDSSPLHNNGILTGVATGLPGVSGLGYGFSGEQSLAKVPHSPSLNPQRKPFTVTVAFKITPRMRGLVDVDLVRKGLSTTSKGDWKLDLHGRAKSLRVRAVIIGSKASVVLGPAGPKVNDGQWHQAALARVGDLVTLSVDGQVVASVRRDVGKIRNSSPLTIGAKPHVVADGGAQPDADWFRGLIDEVSVTIG